MLDLLVLPVHLRHANDIRCDVVHKGVYELATQNAPGHILDRFEVVIPKELRGHRHETQPVATHCRARYEPRPPAKKDF